MRRRRKPRMWLGILLILVGLSIVLNMIFGINIPVFRTFIALFFVYLGLKMLFGGRWFNVEWDGGNNENAAIFSSRSFNYTGQIVDGFHTAFGSSVIDVTSIADGPRALNINTAFGNTHIRIKRDLPVAIEMKTFLASGSMPDGSLTVVGMHSHTTDAARTSNATLKISASVAFGSTSVELVD